MDYVLHLVTMISIYVILTSSTNLLVGVTNLVSLGQGALYGVGAYVAAGCLLGLGLSLVPTILLVMLVTGILSFLVAYPSIRLRGDYFILATLGFQLIIFSVLNNWDSLTRGPSGVPGIPPPRIVASIAVSGEAGFCALSLALALAVIFLLFRLIHSPFGRVLRGIRDDEIAVVSLGKNIASFKIRAVVISSSLVGVAGMLYATYLTYIDPAGFNLDESIFILSAVLIGGLGNIRGPVAGAIFVVMLPELLRFVGLPESIAANLRQIVYGMLLVVLMRVRPQGFFGKLEVR